MFNMQDKRNTEALIAKSIDHISAPPPARKTINQGPKSLADIKLISDSIMGTIRHNYSHFAIPSILPNHSHMKGFLIPHKLYEFGHTNFSDT